MYSLVYTTLVAIQSRTYLTKAELIETNREPIVGDLVYGSDSYYAQIVRVGEGIVEITVIGQIANLQAVYDLLDLKADKTELDAYAKLAASNVFTQPQQVPNATLPQHTTNKLQVETMFEMFKQQLRGYNLAMPNLTGKEYLGNGEYILIKLQNQQLNYNVYSGLYVIPNDSQLTGGAGRIIPFLLDNDIYTVSVENLNNGVVEFVPYIDFTTVGESIGTSNSTFVFDNSQGLYNGLYIRTNQGNMQFKLQIEKGTTATPYTVPGKIPQYKIVGEE